MSKLKSTNSINSPSMIQLDIFTQKEIEPKEKRSRGRPIQITGEKALLSAYEIGEPKINLDIVKDTLYSNIKSIQSNMARNGYYEDTLCDLLNTTKKEIKLFFDNKLPKESSLNIRHKLESFKIRF